MTSTSSPVPAAAAQGPRNPRVRSLVWRLAAVLAITGAAAVYDRAVQTSHQRDQIETVAAWRISEVRQWLAGVQAQVGFLQGSPDWREAQLRWLESGDDAARDALVARASGLVRHFGGHSAWLLDGQGAVLATDAAAPEPVSAELRRALHDALRGDIVRQTGLYPAALEPGAVWFDTVVPLTASGGADRAAMVLRVDASSGLLARWAVPAATTTGTAGAMAAAQLARLEGGRLFVGADREGQTVAATGSLLGRAVRGELPLGLAAAGEGTDGQAVLGAVQRVPQTDWFVWVQVPQAALRGAMLARTLWILAAGIGACLGIGALAVLRWRRLRTGPLSAGPASQGAAGDEDLLQPAGAVADGFATSMAGSGSSVDTVPACDPRTPTSSLLIPSEPAPDARAAWAASPHEPKPSARLSTMDDAIPIHDAAAHLQQPGSPVSRCRADAAVMQSARRRPLAGARVLLVEDNLINQEVAREALVSAGLQVVAVGDGRQALQQLQKECFDLVLMDVQMPVMDGLEATRQLRRMPGLQRLPVLAMTANAYDEHRKACVEAGMNDHLRKPIDLGQLYGTLARWLSPPQAVDSAAVPQRSDEPGVRHDVQQVALPSDPSASTEPGVAHGLNCARALVNLAGREDVYHRVLARFLSHHGSLHEELPRWCAARDGGSIQRAMHSLRGSSVAVGADHLVTCAQTVEAALTTAGADVLQPPGPADKVMEGALDCALAAVLQELHFVEDHIRSLLSRGV